MQVKPDTALFEQLDGDLPCEDPYHDEDGNTGPGMWYVKIHCPACGKGSKGLYLLCNDYIEDIEAGALVTCNSCDTKDISGMQMFTIMGKR